MANQLDAIKQIEKAIADLISKLNVLDSEIIDISKSAREAASSFNSIKTPKDVQDKIDSIAKSTSFLTDKIKERERQEKALNTAIARQETVLEETNKALIKTRFETQQQNKLIKEATVLSSRYSSELQKASVKRNQLAKTIQDLNLKRQLGIKLSNQEQKELKQSTTEFNKYDNAIKKAKISVNRFQENVGNYPQLLGNIRSLATGLIGSFGILEGLRLSFDFAKEAVALAREARGVEFAFKQLGAQGLEAFENIKRSTRGLLSDLDIKRSLNEFKNFNISLEETDTLFEFLAVRAAQTGRSVDSLKDSLVEGLSKESKLRIDNLGISAAKLNEELERTPDFVQAVANIAKQEIAEAGNILDETASSQEKFNAAFENFKVSAGSGFIGKLTNSLYDLGTALVSATTDINDASDGFFDFVKNLALYAQGQGSVVAGEAILKRELEKRKPIVEEIIAIQKEQGVIELQLNQNREKYLKTNSQELIAILKSLQAKKEENETVKESVKFLRDKITGLEKEKEALTINDLARSKAINNEIQKTKELINTILLLNGAREKGVVRTEAFKEALENIDKVKDAFKDVFKEDLSLKELKAPELDFSQFENGTLKDLEERISSSLIKAFDKELLNESLDDLSETIQFFTGANGQVFSDFFRKITSEGIKSFEDIADVAESSFDVIGEIANAYYNANIERYEADIEANNLYYENLLANQTLTDSERERLEADRAAKEEEIRKKQRREQIKQAQFERAIQIAQIITNTAKAVVQSLPNIPLAIAVGAIGAAQLGIALATPIPQFKDGHLSGTHEGLAIINDASGGNYQEVVQRKDGTLEMYKDRNQLINMQRGDKVFKAGTHGAEDYLKGISDKELMKDVNKHSFIASLQHQNYMIAKLENAKSMNNDKLNTDRIVKAINSKKTKFNLNQSINIGEDLSFLKRLDF